MNLSVIKNFLTGSSGNLIKDIGDAANNLFTSKGELKEFQVKLKELENATEQNQQNFILEFEKTQLENKKTEIDMVKAAIASDNSQDDKYVKRARPTVIYSGLTIIFLEMFGLRALILSSIASKFALKFESIAASSDSVLNMFFIAWTGIVGVYGYGRSKEKIATKKADIFNKTGEVINTGKAIKDMFKW